MPLTYRRMTPADFPACARELIAAFAEEPWSEVWTYEQAYDRIEEIMSARVSRGIVCMDGEICVSMLCGRIMTYQDKKSCGSTNSASIPRTSGRALAAGCWRFCARSC